MKAREHSTFREGIVAGLLGGLIVAIWYLLFDAASGHPLQTPNTLGRIFLRGDVNPGLRALVPKAILGYTVLHFVLYALAGIALTLLIHLATRNIALRMGVWLGLVIAFCFFVGLAYMLTISTAQRLPVWSVLGGSVLGVGAMGAYLWRRHPQLGRSLDRAPLGSEVKAPPHPPERGRPG
jgi:ABC-type Mn2+/Zn2+ transport system permease subunit